MYVMMFPADEERFTVNVDVHVSRQFLGWIISLGEDIKIAGPDEVVDKGTTQRGYSYTGYEYDGQKYHDETYLGELKHSQSVGLL